MESINKLFASLNQRQRPEDIAEIILQLEDTEFTKAERSILNRAARGSLIRTWWQYTSMSEEFLRPVGAQKQIAKARELFDSAFPMSAEHCDDPEKIEAFIKHIGPEIRKVFGHSDFKQDRLNREAREKLGLELSRRRYNKLFRHLSRLESKLEKLLREIKKHRLTKIGKSALAHTLNYDNFAADSLSASFIAYFTARSNLRSEFTIYGQQRPFDEIANMLFRKCQQKQHTNWWAIAHVFPHPEVLEHISEEQKGILLGRWFNILQETAALLEETWAKSDINRKTMVVKRGNDSSTWNNSANAWNKAREHWVALLYALNLEEMLDSMCFGKVLRLMAADVVAWHSSSGGGLDPDTAVWNELPLPWQVLSGVACPRALVEETCRKYGIDPKQGWTLPKPYQQVAKFRPTPELVHGVSVSNPHLASILRKAGFFSGYSSQPPLLSTEAIAVHYETLQEHHHRLLNQADEVE